jgi:hypothetical protein
VAIGVAYGVALLADVGVIDRPRRREAALSHRACFLYREGASWGDSTALETRSPPHFRVRSQQTRTPRTPAATAVNHHGAVRSHASGS